MKEKILFWLDSNLLSFCISYFLQKKTDYELFALIDITNKSKKFFQEQKLVTFSESWFYHDHINSTAYFDKEFLHDFEQRFDVNLWELSQNERIFNFYNEILTCVILTYYATYYVPKRSPHMIFQFNKLIIKFISFN